MSKKKPYYAVYAGRKIGIFTTWEQCDKSVNGYQNNGYHSFRTFGEARHWLEKKLRERGIEPPKDYGIIQFPEF
jgi:viroplasmin and RNaseH domain-containing protein